MPPEGFSNLNNPEDNLLKTPSKMNNLENENEAKLKTPTPRKSQTIKKSHTFQGTSARKQENGTAQGLQHQHTQVLGRRPDDVRPSNEFGEEKSAISYDRRTNKTSRIALSNASVADRQFLLVNDINPAQRDKKMREKMNLNMVSPNKAQKRE